MSRRWRNKGMGEVEIRGKRTQKRGKIRPLTNDGRNRKEADERKRQDEEGKGRKRI